MKKIVQKGLGTNVFSWFSILHLFPKESIPISSDWFGHPRISPELVQNAGRLLKIQSLSSHFSI
jgi:hypothetical protein